MAAKFIIETDGTPRNTKVIATLADGLPVSLTVDCCRIDKSADDPRVYVTLIGTTESFDLSEPVHVKSQVTPLDEDEPGEAA